MKNLGQAEELVGLLGRRLASVKEELGKSHRENRKLKEQVRDLQGKVKELESRLRSERK